MSGHFIFALSGSVAKYFASVVNFIDRTVKQKSWAKLVGCKFTSSVLLLWQSKFPAAHPYPILRVRYPWLWRDLPRVFLSLYACAQGQLIIAAHSRRELPESHYPYTLRRPQPRKSDFNQYLRTDSIQNCELEMDSWLDLNKRSVTLLRRRETYKALDNATYTFPMFLLILDLRVGKSPTW